MYLLTRDLLGLITFVARDDASKNAELLVFRHETRFRAERLVGTLRQGCLLELSNARDQGQSSGSETELRSDSDKPDRSSEPLRCRRPCPPLREKVMFDSGLDRCAGRETTMAAFCAKQGG